MQLASVLQKLEITILKDHILNQYLALFFAVLSDHMPEKSTWGPNPPLINNFCNSGNSTTAETETYFTISDSDIPITLNLNSLALLHR